jgi:hypothetical protein
MTHKKYGGVLREKSDKNQELHSKEFPAYDSEQAKILL